MSEPIAAKPQPQTSVQWQQKYLASLSAKGLERITLVLDDKTVQLMRDISRVQCATLADVVKLGTLTAERELEALRQAQSEGRMTERPIYRTLDIAPIQRYFDCQPLRASINTAACAQRWASAESTSQCHQCELGRLHHSDHHPTKQPRRRNENVSTCLRCGRTDLRTIKVTGLCVSCHIRQQEWIKGCNAKGKPPITFQPLHSVELTVQRADSSQDRHLVQARDDAEALGRILRGLPAGARLQTSERRTVAWNATTGAFEHVCERCGTAGFIVERLRGEGLWSAMRGGVTASQRGLAGSLLKSAGYPSRLMLNQRRRGSATPIQMLRTSRVMRGCRQRIHAAAALARSRRDCLHQGRDGNVGAWHADQAALNDRDKAGAW